MLASTETMAIRRHKVHMKVAKQRHVQKVSVRKETFRVNADSLVTDVKIARADSVKMAIDRNLIQSRFESHVRA